MVFLSTWFPLPSHPSSTLFALPQCTYPLVVAFCVCLRSVSELCSPAPTALAPVQPFSPIPKGLPFTLGPYSNLTFVYCSRRYLPETKWKKAEVWVLHSPPCLKMSYKNPLTSFAKPQTGLLFTPVFSTSQLFTPLRFHHSDLLTFSSNIPWSSQILWAFEQRNPPPGGSPLTFFAWQTSTHLSTLLKCHLLSPLLPGRVKWW